MIWAPQPGPQSKATICPVNTTLFGGSRGGGKSDTTIGRHIVGAQRWGGEWNGMIIRRKYKEFAEMRRRWDQLKTRGLPIIRTGGDQGTNHIKFYNGGEVLMTAIENLAMARDWIGHQFTEISVEEATTFPFFSSMIDILKGSLRSAAGVSGHIFCTGNPGGSGHNDVKEFFRLGAHWRSEGYLPDKPWFDHAEQSRIFIPSFLRDNRILVENDPNYVKVLLSISDPALRAAWLKGDWDVFIGQAFSWVSRWHEVDPVWPIPTWAPIYMTYDWGYSAPFSIGWWFVDNDGRGIRFAEWYGWNGKPNQGLRMEDSEIAKQILVKEAEMKIDSAKVDRIAGPDCFSRKPNYQGGGQGPPTAEIFRSVDQRLQLRPGDPDRKVKIRQFRERLKLPRASMIKLPGEELGAVIGPPMLQVYKTCRHFIRTVPSLAIDEDNVEDVDSEQEDHCVTGDTLLNTEFGEIPIKDLVGTSGRLLTIGGFLTDYSNCRMTRRLADIVRVVFKDGRSIRCTPDHKFLTIKGYWKEAKDLPNETCHDSISHQSKTITEVLCKSKSSMIPPKVLMEKVTGFVGNTFSVKGNDYIELSGNTIMDLFQKVVRFTTRIPTGPIIRSKTWNVAKLLSMLLITPNKMITMYGLSPCIEGPQNGMVALMELSGINSSMKNIVGKHFLKRLIKLANIVDAILKGQNFQNTVRENASKPPGKGPTERQESALFAEKNTLVPDELVHHIAHHCSPGTPARVLRVEPAGKADVYCLNAKHTHAFSVQGGIMIHNCYDEACHFVMARPMAVEAEDVEKQMQEQRVQSARARLPQEQQTIWSELDEIRRKIDQMDQGWDGRVGGRVV